MLDAKLLNGVVTLKTGWPNEHNIRYNNVGSNVASNVAFVWPPLYLIRDEIISNERKKQTRQ